MEHDAHARECIRVRDQPDDLEQNIPLETLGKILSELLEVSGLIADGLPCEEKDSLLEGIEVLGGKVRQQVLDFRICPSFISQRLGGLRFASATVQATCHHREDQGFDPPGGNGGIPCTVEDSGERCTSRRAPERLQDSPPGPE
jgi:hypothetical protein